MKPVNELITLYEKKEINEVQKARLKNHLITGLLDYEITDSESEILLKLFKKSDFRELIMRIFDLNSSSELAESESQKRTLYFLSKVGKKIKNWNFKRKIRKPYYRDKRKVIIAEGDSWFEYPLIVNDIPDWLLKNNNYLLYSISNAGDWIANIVYEEEYIEQLSIYQPEVLLISGGGNDLVGGGRLSLLVNKPEIAKQSRKYQIPDKEKIIIQNFGNGETGGQKRAEMIIEGSGYLGKDFFVLLKTFELMNKMIFSGILKSGKFNDIKIITVGYDFAVPSNNRNFFKNPARLFMGNGNWLYYPLIRKGISLPFTQECVVSAFIYHFNEMMINAAEYCNRKAGKNYVFHIDSRGVLKKNDWADELHPLSQPFRRISKVYESCINGFESLDKVNPYIYPVRFY